MRPHSQAKGADRSTLIVEGERPHPHVGKAIFIDNQVDTHTSTFLMRAEVPNPDGSLLPGQYIRAELTIGEYVDAVVVPGASGRRGPGRARGSSSSTRQNKVEVAKVKPVDDYQGLRVLESGLEAGQKVIVEGIQLVRPGQVVEPVEVPLEKFMRDRRRRSRTPIAASPARSLGFPGSIPRRSQTRPNRHKEAGPIQGKAEPEPSPKAAPESGASPRLRSSATPEKKAR